MKIAHNIVLTLAVCVSLFACSSHEESQFVGVWSNACQEEVDAVGIYDMFDTLTLVDDNTFVRKLTYVNLSNTDTIAKVVVSGMWQVNDSCLEMAYATDSISVACDDAELNVAFYNDMATKINLANGELKKAHEQDETHGIKCAYANEKAIISKSPTSSREIYFRVK